MVWGANHTSQFQHHLSKSPSVIVRKVVGHHLFLNITPINFTARTKRKVWCDQRMSVYVKHVGDALHRSKWPQWVMNQLHSIIFCTYLNTYFTFVNIIILLVWSPMNLEGTTFILARFVMSRSTHLDVFHGVSDDLTIWNLRAQYILQSFVVVSPMHHQICCQNCDNESISSVVWLKLFSKYT